MGLLRSKCFDRVPLVAEYHFHVHGARLLLQIQHVVCNASHFALETPVSKSVHGYSCRHAHPDIPGVDLVYWSRNIEAGIVYDIHCGWSRHTNRRGGDILEQLTGYFSD